MSVSAKLDPAAASQWNDIPPEDGGATSVELRVTASFKILSESFQWFV
jgi:hypothetical protein